MQLSIPHRELIESLILKMSFGREQKGLCPCRLRQDSKAQSSRMTHPRSHHALEAKSELEPTSDFLFTLRVLDAETWTSTRRLNNLSGQMYKQWVNISLLGSVTVGSYQELRIS